MQLPRDTRPLAESGEDLAPRNDGDRFLAACSYFFAPIFGWIVYLFSFRTPSYRRYHAQQAIAFGLIVLGVQVLSALPRSRAVAVVAFLVPLAFEFFYATKAYAASEPFTIPYVTPLTRRLFPTFPG